MFKVVVSGDFDWRDPPLDRNVKRTEPMTTVIEGTIMQGLGAARKTVRLQMPHLVQQFPQIHGCYEATINLQLDRPLRVNNPDHTTGLIRWYPQAPPEWAGEKFSFLRIKFECPLGELFAMRGFIFHMTHRTASTFSSLK
jgi:hypothetical protein